MSPNKTIEEIIALRDAAIEDLLSLSDEELRIEAKQDGQDLEAIALETKRLMREGAAAALRLRMSTSRVKPALAAAPRRTPMIRPSVERMKQLVERVFANNPSAGLAFRQGKKQSDSDWQTLYDDYVSMGAIEPEDDKH
jgi:hypothetical protein